MRSNQCLWLLRQLTLFAWLYSLAHKKGTLHVQENVEKKFLILVTDSWYFDGSKTFRLTLKPSSLNVVTDDFDSEVQSFSKFTSAEVVSQRNLLIFLFTTMLNR